MGYLEKAREHIKKSSAEDEILAQDYKENFLPLTGMKIKDFAKRNLAIQVYSKTLGEEVWFCSNASMEKKVITDQPESVCYTTDELLEIIKLDLTKERLMKFHELKKTFRGKVLKVSSVI